MGLQWLGIVVVLMVIAWFSFSSEPVPVVAGDADVSHWELARLDAVEWSRRENSDPSVFAALPLSIDQPPLQTDLDSNAPRVRWAAGQMALRAQYGVEGRVLGTRRYRNDKESEVSGLDVALGWRRMADPKVLDAFEISQRNRFYFWKTERFPIPRQEVETSSANKHMIAANPEVERVLMSMKEGQVVRLAGYLVDVDWDDGYRWRTSRTRDDTGKGACEIVWVHHAEIL